MNFCAAVFDLDGTLLDSMDVWENIVIAFLKKRGLSVPDGYVTQICARSFIKAAEYTIDLFHLPESVDAIIHEWNEMAAYEEETDLTYGDVFRRTEQRLLRKLVENPGVVLTRNTLTDEIWSGDSEYVEEHALTVVIKRLRAKLRDSVRHAAYIKTVYGIGYVWDNQRGSKGK